jgi:hypothetical protein
MELTPPTQIISLAPRLRAIHLAHLLWRAMSAIRYRREQGGLETLFEKSVSTQIRA